MKKGLFVLTLAALAGFGFNTSNGFRAGTFGGSPDYLALSISGDGTFTYVDRTKPSEPISTKGRWELTKGIIVLIPEETKGRLFLRWRPDGGDCIRSRHGLEWRRLCRISDPR